MEGIVSVPVNVKTLRTRGFNQTLLMARLLSKHLQIPLRMDILSKTKETKPQIGLGAKEWALNLKKSFEAREGV